LWKEHCGAVRAGPAGRISDDASAAGLAGEAIVRDTVGAEAADGHGAAFYRTVPPEGA
jgi:hypothetical protein